MTRKRSSYHTKLLLIILTLVLVIGGCTTTAPSDTDIDEPKDTVLSNSPNNETNNESNNEEHTPTQRSDKILIATVDFPPFEVVKDGNFSGPGIDITDAVFERMGYTKDQYEFVTYPWARVLENIKTGDVDMIIDLSITEERLEYINYSTETFTNYEKHFMVLKDSDIDFDNSLESIQEYTIGVVRDYYNGPNYQEARKTGQYNFEDASSFDENVDKLISGRVPIIYDTTFAVLSHLSEKGESDQIKVLGEAYDTTITFVGFSKILNNNELLEGFDKAFGELKSEGVVKEIHKKYFE